jgi:hypothetical protein
MTTKEKYQHLEKHPDKRSQELFVRGTGVRASTVWHDRPPKFIDPWTRGGK